MTQRRPPSATTGPVSRRKVKKVLGEYQDKTLRSSSGTPVTNPKPALAIALSAGRRA